MKNTISACLLILLASACKKENDARMKNANDVAVNTLAVTNYYVSPNGKDTASGTSDQRPLKTIQAALGKTVNGAGATIYVAAGTYSERLVFPSSGASAAEPITLTNYAGGTVILDGASTNSSSAPMIDVSSKSYLRINNITIANNIRAGALGIYIHGAGTDIQVTGCKLYNIGYTTDSTVTPQPTDNANPFLVVGNTDNSYNQLYIGNNQIYSCNPGYSEALTLNGNVENFLIEGNVIHHVRNIGIDIAGHYIAGPSPANNQARNGNVKYNTVYKCVSRAAVSAGIYVDGGKWINIEGNRSYENGTGVSVGCEKAGFTAESINVRDNFIYNNINAGIIVGSNAAGSNVLYAAVTNNVFYRNFTQGGWGGEISIQTTDHLSIKNNIIESNNPNNISVIALDTSTNMSMDYNRYYSVGGSAGNAVFDWGVMTGTGYVGLAAFTAATGLDAHSVYGVPGFVNAASSDFHLAAGSLSINTGDPAFVTGSGELDIDKQTRLQGGRVDVGADERQ